MTTLKTYAYSFVLLLLLSSYGLLAGWAQAVRPDTARTAPNSAPVAQQHVRGVQYSSPEEAAAALEAQKRLPLFAGISVSADVAGAVMATFTPYGQYEAAARINLRGRYFPTFEMGMGHSDHTDETTEIHYKVNSPYFRVGMDYNVAKDLRSGNRIFVGARYGFTSFKYDMDGPDLTDPIYGGQQPFRFTGIRGTNHWGEIVAGLEAKVWGILHLGWTVRYRMRLYNQEAPTGSPWYVPGYGKNDTHALGGTFLVIFDI